MSNLVCRDCGFQLQEDARGCPKCALNFDAEKMIDRLVWQRVVPGVAILMVAAITLIYLLR